MVWRPQGGDPVHLGQLAKIGLRVGKVCSRFKVAKHFELEIAQGSFSYRRKQQSIEAEAALDGFYAIRTSVPPRRWKLPLACRGLDPGLQVPAGVLLPFCERERIVGHQRSRLDRLSAKLLESGGRNGPRLSPHSVHSYSDAINHFLS